MTDYREFIYKVLCPFGGSSGGALGFIGAEARLPNLGVSGRFECMGSVDFDADACVDFERFTGSPAWCVNVETVTGAMVRERFGARRPDVVFMSPPCKGSSRLLSTAKSRDPRYRRMNRLAVVWTIAMLDAWRDDPPPIVLLENVPGLPTRARAMLRSLRSLLRAAGYVFHQSTHDCGEIGGLAQHRERFLLIARRPKVVPSFIYQPPKRRVRACGEVLGELPLPTTPAAAAWGQLHTLPKIEWRNWLRLALIPPGGDWRDLEGVLREGQERREVFRRHAVANWSEPIEAVTGPGGHTVGAVSDPRWHAGAWGVRAWDEPSGAVTGGADNPSRGRFTIADPRVDELRVPVGFDAAYGVLAWSDPARTVAGTAAVGCGAYSVADPRDRAGVEARVLTMDEALALDLPPRKAPPFVPVIVSPHDGAWHRPVTLLELAVLQSYPAMMHGAPIVFAGKRTAIAEHIGNSVPPAAARPIAEQMLIALVEGSLGVASMRAGSIWVEPEWAMEAGAGWS